MKNKFIAVVEWLGYTMDLGAESGNDGPMLVLFLIAAVPMFLTLFLTGLIVRLTRGFK